MSAAWRIARRELRSGLSGFRVMLACLALGTASIAAIGTLRAGIEAGLSEQGAVILGGDAEIELTYRAATPAEREWMAARATAMSEMAEFRSMASSGASSGASTGAEIALTQVKAVDSAYPLLGAVELMPAMSLAEAFAERGGVAGAVMEPVLADRLGLKVGDEFTLGGLKLRLSARLLREPDSAGAGIGFGPRTMLARAALEGSQLLAQGSLFDMEYKLLLPSDTDLDAFKAEAEAAITGADARDRRRAAGGVERFVERIGSFLVLVGLAGLAVGGVGIAASTRAWAERKAETIATLKAMGAPLATIRAAFALQLALVVALGVGLGLALGAGLPLALGGVISRLMPFPIDLALAPRALIEAASYGVLIAAIFAALPLARLLATRPAALYREGETAAVGGRVWALIGGLSAALFGLAVALAASRGLAAATLAGVIAALLLLSLCARGLQALARKAAPRARGRAGLRAALSALGAARGETASVFIALGLGLSVLSAIGQVDAGLRGAIAQDLPEIAPAYFVLDIQPDQIGPFKDQIKAMPEVSKLETAPMLRGSITAINGRPARAFGDHWVLRGDRGLTYAQTPPEATPMVAGRWWAADYAGPPLVSFAQKEAEELGLKLGDQITVAVLGREITAEIASLRAVDFSTAGMGFVMLFNPAALQGAPHTNIATLYTAPEHEAGVLRALARAYPNITAIGVREALARVSEAMAAIAQATALAAGVTLLTGFAVLIGAAAAGERARAREAALLKTLGATRGLILRSLSLRVVILGAAAGVIALGIGALAGWAVLVLVMETSYRFAPLPAALILLGGVMVTLIANIFYIWRPLRLSPASVLRAPE